jgi:hypothetical protein
VVVPSDVLLNTHRFRRRQPFIRKLKKTAFVVGGAVDPPRKEIEIKIED